MKKTKIALVTIGLAMASVASAAVVNYLSDAVVATVEVKSPVDMNIYKGDYDSTKTGSNAIAFTTYGGSSMPFTTIATNNANERIGGYYVMVIEAIDLNDKMTGKEFTEMMWKETPWVNLRDDFVATGSDIISELCVVHSDGTLEKLSDWTDANPNGNKKLVIFWDSDGNSQQVNNSISESTGMCSPLTIYLNGETRSVTHLNASGASGLNPRSWTFTPTWNTGATGNFTITSQHVSDLASYAAEQYSN